MCSGRCKGCLGADQRHVGHQVHEHPRVELHIGVNGADLELPVLEELRQAYALRTGIREVDLSGDASLEQRQMFWPAHAGNQEVQIMELRRVRLDQRTGQKIRLLLIITLESHGIPRLDQRLQCLDDRSGLQHTPLHPRREPRQARGLLRPAARPTVRPSVEPNGRIHVDTFQELPRSLGACAPGAHNT